MDNLLRSVALNTQLDMRNDLTTALGGTFKMPRQALRYLLAGGVNTAFAYSLSVGLYYALRQHVHIAVIGTIANVISITEAFVTYKLFVFDSRAPWLREYLRCYVVYGGIALFSIAGLYLLVDVFGIPFWFAQVLLNILVIVASFTGHNRFTFKKAQHE